MTLGSSRWGIGRVAAATAIAAATLAVSGCGLLLNRGGNALDQTLDELEQNLDELENPSGTTEEDVFNIGVGDCFPSEETQAEGEVSTVQTVPCSEPHDGEAYAAGDMPDGDFPGEVEIQNFADDFCITEFDLFVGVSYEQSELDFTYYYPTAESWASGDREILCVVYDPAGDVTGTLEGAAR
ncbi:septum formation family protein [Thermobifida cellulosilytica]|uniref:Septum formation-related domain-containing protein n=1 Tax=Thermobifida cellulosilytica TB100 TaxID=665004 RepID=A0A147KFN2_THECS|nr:septum formation family protein [Thermobifida cellulosilytica]KUP96121.1 hypothetical protein AC529_13805 [Thermobifida cellulosilytica TB100]